MNKSFFTLLVSSILFAGCGDKDSPGTAHPGTEGAQDQDISSCTGPDETTVEGAWKFTSKHEGVIFHVTYFFNHGNVYLSNNCVFPEIDLELTAETYSTYIDSGESFKFLQSNSKTERHKDSEMSADCTASIQAITIDYEIKGKCLIFTAGSEQLILKR